MNESDVQESLTTLYLRLNGYFTAGFIAHAASRTMSEVDVLAVHFPQHREPEREIGNSEALGVPKDQIDFIVGEVKGRRKNIRFNSALRSPTTVRKILDRFGAFSGEEVEHLCKDIPEALEPTTIRRMSSLPEFPVLGGNGRLRFKLFAPCLLRQIPNTVPYIFGDDLMEYIWQCFRPERMRAGCATQYDYGQWGPYETIVRYFKDSTRTSHGTVADLCTWVQDAGSPWSSSG